MYTLVQDGITPLTEEQMHAVMASTPAFMEALVGPEVPIRFDHLVEVMRAPYNDWSDDLGRAPTGLEIMAACCTLSTQGRLRFDFIEGLMHVASVPCDTRE